MKDISYCILNDRGIVGAYGLDAKGEFAFSPLLLVSLAGAERIARRLTNVSKCRHAVSLYDMDTGAVFRAPANPPSSYQCHGTAAPASK